MHPPFTLSAWSLGEKCTLRERLSAAKEAGFASIGMRIETYLSARNEGYSDGDILSLLEEYQIPVCEVEYITAWADRERTVTQQMREVICLHMCELFHVKHINCGLLEHYGIEQLTETFAALCHRVYPYKIALEPMPYSSVDNSHTAWQIIQNSGAQNAGLLLDSWHWMRANQSYSDSELAEVPADAILAVQLNDVKETPFPPETLREESLHHRLPPGAGYGDTVSFLKMLLRKGVNPTVWSGEVISDSQVAKGVDVAAKECFAGLETVWKEATQ